MASPKKVGYVSSPSADRMFYNNENLRTIPDSAIIVRGTVDVGFNDTFGRVNEITQADIGYTKMSKVAIDEDGTPVTTINNSLKNRMTTTLGDSELFSEINARGLSAVEVIPRASKTQVGIVTIGTNIDVDSVGLISVKTGSKSNLGLLQVGNNLNVTNGVISLATASKSTLGGIIVGDNIDVDASGKISLQKATTSAFGIVKIGSNISVASDSTISVPVATANALGVVRTGSNITNSSGVISVPIASTSTLGVVKAGQNITIDADGKINGVNSYVHPSTHPATMITEDSTHRFTTDAEKTKWNAMLPLAGGTMTGTITLKNASGSWIAGRDNACLFTTVNASAYTSGISLKSSTHTFSFGSLGNGQGGIYMYSNSRTANGNDGSLYLDTSGNAYCSGMFTAAGDIVGMSDKRIKRDIHSIENALELVEKLDGVMFTWKKNGKRSLGLIAQDVQEILPEAVEYYKDTKTYGVKYSNMVGLLINAVKELHQKVIELESK